MGADKRRRWLLVGSGGAGKSTLARQLATALDIPLIHLDQEYWQPGWVAVTKDQWRIRVAEVAAGGEWVMDGNYSGTIDMRLDRADVVVVMDTPSWKCLFRIVKRRWFDRDRPDLPSGCSDQVTLEFAWWVLSYPWRSRPKIMRAIQSHADVEVIRLRTARDAERLLEDL